MKKISLGQTITILANIGVIAGIVFLRFEMRQNTIAVKSTAAQGIHDQIVSIQSMLIDESMSGLIGKGINSPYELTLDEVSKVNAFFYAAFFGGQNLYFQIRRASMTQNAPTALGNK